MEEQCRPVAPIGLNDVQAMTSILFFYERYLRHAPLPATQREQQITVVQMLRVKVALMTTAKMAVVTYEDVALLLTAIDVFTDQLRKRVASSKSRDELLESCAGLREYLVRTFLPGTK